MQIARSVERERRVCFGRATENWKNSNLKPPFCDYEAAAAEMSLFGDFQSAWCKRFPGCNLPQAWEEDVRANLAKHRQRVAVLKEELEKESFYVEYLERLLADVEKHRRSIVAAASAEETSSPQSVIGDDERNENEEDDAAANDDDDDEAVTQHGGASTNPSGVGLLLADTEKSDAEAYPPPPPPPDDAQISTVLIDNGEDKSESPNGMGSVQPELSTPTSTASDPSDDGGGGNSSVGHNNNNKGSQFITVIEVNGYNVENGTPVKTSTPVKDSPSTAEDDGGGSGGIAGDEDDESSKSCQLDSPCNTLSDSTNSSPAVKKKVPPKPPPKRIKGCSLPSSPPPHLQDHATRTSTKPSPGQPVRSANNIPLSQGSSQAARLSHTHGTPEKDSSQAEKDKTNSAESGDKSGSLLHPPSPPSQGLSMDEHNGGGPAPPPPPLKVKPNGSVARAPSGCSTRLLKSESLKSTPTASDMDSRDYKKLKCNSLDSRRSLAESSSSSLPGRGPHHGSWKSDGSRSEELIGVAGAEEEEEEGDYINLKLERSSEYDDHTLKSEKSVLSGYSSHSGGGLSDGDGGRITESPGSAALTDGTDDTDGGGGGEGEGDESPKYSDYVNIDYFLRRKARMTGRTVSMGESVTLDSDDDDGTGVFLQSLVSDKEDVVGDESHHPASHSDKDPMTGGKGEVAGRLQHHVTPSCPPHTDDVIDGDSGVYSSSVESTSFLCPSTPPTPPSAGKWSQSQGGQNLHVSVANCEEAERITMIKCIISSILESETIYWECLNVLIQYMKALRATIGTSQPVISEEDLSIIFHKIPELHAIHQSFLEGIRNRVKNWDGKLTIGDHFKILASRLGVYASFLQNYPRAIEAVRKCSSENAKFSDTTKSIKLKALKGQIMTLEDLLHKPVARVQRNALVLHDLLKYTPESHPDHKTLQVALRMTQCFLNEFNMSATESMFPAHDRTQRHLVKNSFIVELSEGRRKLRHLFLFNDVIVCAKYKASGREKFSYEVKWYIALHDVVLPPDDDDDKDVKETSPVNVLTLKSQVATVRDLIMREEHACREKSWGGSRNVDRLRKKLAELQAQLMLASPNLVFRVGQKTGKVYLFFLSSKFERSQWIEAITAVEATAPQVSVNVTLYELQAWITACHKFLQTNMGSFLLRSGKEDEILVGDLHVNVHSLQGLKKPSDIYLCLEVDSYGHFFRKATTKVCGRSVDPVWNQEFIIELEGSQMLRILCYEMLPNQESVLRGKAALELSRSWLNASFQEKQISLQDFTLSVSLKFTQCELSLRRVPSSKPCGIFGLKISHVMKKEKRNIPFLITCCVREVEKRGVHELGIYRVSGSASDLQKLKRSFETNPYEAEQLVKEVDIHSVTGILKLYLRELPEGLFTDELYSKFLEAFGMADGDAKSTTLINLFNSLPPGNKAIIMYLIDHMVKIIKQESENKMSLQNIATVFGPTLLRPSTKSESGSSLDKLAAGTIDVMAQAGILYFFLKKRAAGEITVATD